MVFCLPLLQGVSVICMLLFIIVSVFQKDFLYNIRKAFAFRLNFIPVIFYFLHVFGLLFTVNYPYAMADLETKLSFLVFPLLFMSFPSGRKDFLMIALSFAAGCTIAAVACMIHALYSYAGSHNPSSFIYEDYSFIMHPTYFTLYINLAFILLLKMVLDSWNELHSKVKVPAISALAFLMINIILLGARTATATAFVTIVIYAASAIIARRAFIKGIMVFLICSVLVFIIQVKVMRIGSDRAAQVEHILDKNSKPNSANIRFYLWRNAWEVIKEHPVFGVGTGDIKAELIAKYNKNDFSIGVDRNYSPHNQFFHTTVILGCVGLSVLLLMFLIPLIQSVRTRDVIYSLFLLMVFMNCMTEDIIEVQKGIIFFVFFYTLFYRINSAGNNGILSDRS
jgi:O-antigen ligase